VHDQPNDPFKSPGDVHDEPARQPDLPPVEPPSAGFVVQLFVIPAAVVLVVIVVWLLFGKLAGGERDAIEYVRKLRSPTANWRLAFELASLIQHDPKIGSDPVLLGELTQSLSEHLDQGDVDPELTQYLALTLGAFQTLEARTESGQNVDPLVPLARALASKYKPRVRLAAAASMAKQAARMNGQLDDPRAVKALGEAASSGEPEVRQMAVYALGFFGGASATEILRDRVKSDEDRFARYNAAVALARRGDSAALATLQEMLSTSDLSKVLDLASTTEKQNKIESIELEAIEALRTSISKGSPALAHSLQSSIAELTKSGLVSVRSQALDVLQSLQSHP
jgi:HEAT repeat protein